MKKLISAVLALALGAGMLAGCGGNANTGSSAPDNSAAPGGTSSSDTAPAGDKTLNLYTWQGMFPQEVLDGFTQETGIAINYANFDTDENMLARLEAAGGGDYDVVIADDYIIQTVIAEGLAQKLDTAKLMNWGNIDPVFQGQFYDPTNEYTVPYGSGVQTIVYNPALVQKEITGYGDLWDETLKDNLAVIGNYRVVNGMALKVMGESYNTEDAATIEAAGKKLLELAPNIRLIKNDNVQDDLLSGEVGAAVMYTSQVTLAMLTDPTLKVVYPTEGVGFGIMGTFVPSKAPHPEAAHAFIDYVLRPEVSAQCFEYMGYYCTNQAARDLINDAYKPFLLLPDNIGETEMIQPIAAAAEEAHNRVWRLPGLAGGGDGPEKRLRPGGRHRPAALPPPPPGGLRQPGLPGPAGERAHPGGGLPPLRPAAATEILPPGPVLRPQRLCAGPGDGAVFLGLSHPLPRPVGGARLAVLAGYPIDAGTGPAGDPLRGCQLPPALGEREAGLLPAAAGRGVPQRHRHPGPLRHRHRHGRGVAAGVLLGPGILHPPGGVPALPPPAKLRAVQQYSVSVENQSTAL